MAKMVPRGLDRGGKRFESPDYAALAIDRFENGEAELPSQPNF